MAALLDCSCGWPLALISAVVPVVIGAADAASSSVLATAAASSVLAAAAASSSVLAAAAASSSVLAAAAASSSVLTVDGPCRCCFVVAAAAVVFAAAIVVAALVLTVAIRRTALNPFVGFVSSLLWWSRVTLSFDMLEHKGGQWDGMK